ncbi:MAG: V-type ATPase subunit [Anaerolineae bacterium]
MPLGYGYGNARLRAMRSRLLTPTDYQQLLAKKNLEELIAALVETPYKGDVELALTRLEGVRCVFEAIRTHLARTLRQILTFFEGEPRTLIELILRRWDRHNLLTILRGQSQEVSAEIVLTALTPVGQLDEVSLRELARQPGLRAALDLMTAWQLPYAGALRQVRPRIGSTPDLDQLELALNRFYFSSIRAVLKPGDSNHALLLEQLKIELDLINLRTALQLAHQPGLAARVQQRYRVSDVRPLLLEPGGSAPVELLAQLVAQGGGIEGIVNGLSQTRYVPALAEGWRRYQAGEGDLTVLERELERWQAKHLAGMFSRDPLSLAIPLGYIGCKEVEVANLRLITQAVALNLKRDEIQRDLIMS